MTKLDQGRRFKLQKMIDEINCGPRIERRTGVYSSYIEAIEKLFKPKDHEIRELNNRLTAIAEKYAGCQQLRERIAREILEFLR